MRKLRVYYAHCMALYNTLQEERDEAFLVDLGWRVVNPNSPEHKAGAQKARDRALTRDPSTAAMMYFRPVVHGCDILAFRALPDGAIPAGVALEIQWARDHKMPVIELPSGILRRALTREQTREYIAEVGAW